MIIETTHTDKIQNELINDLVGKPYTLIQTIKLKGIICNGLLIDEVSPNLNEYLNEESDLNFANVELRPYGIIIKINKGVKNYSWVIPFFQLVMYKVNGFSIHSQGRYIHFKKNKTLKNSKAFYHKILNQKIQFESEIGFTAFNLQSQSEDYKLFINY